MGCKHLMWGHYCKKRQEFCRDAFEDHEELCVNCSDYKDENEVTDLKKFFNRGPAVKITVNPDCSTCTAIGVTNSSHKKYPFMTTCENGIYKSTAENDYVSILEKFINNLYPEENFGFLGLDAVGAEQHILQDTKYKGYNGKMVTDAFVKTVNNFRTEHNSVLTRFHTFCMDILLREPHKDYPKKEYPFEFRFVLTLILGYLGKLKTVDIILCHEPKIYFKSQVDHTSVSELLKAVNKTRAYVEESNDIKLAEGMRMVELWFEELSKENIPPKELTIAEIEKQLGYKIKIVGDKK